MKIKSFPKISFYSIILIGIIALTGFIAYANILNSFFLSDDFVLIALLSKLGPFGLWFNQQHGKSLFFRPLLGIISFLDYKIWGLNPFGYHLTNFGFHLANSFLVGSIAFLFSLNLRLDLKLKRFIPYFAGFIFLLLPSHSEAVSWISARTDVIATFFALLSFCTYLNFRHFGKPIKLWISLIAFLAALLCKESIVSFPGLIIAYELYQYSQTKSRNIKKPLINCLLYIAVLGFYFIWRYLKLGTLVGGYGEGIHLKFNPIQILYNLIIYPSRSFLSAQFNSSLTFWIINFIGLVLISIFAVIVSYYRHQFQSNIPQTLLLIIVGFWICVLPAINVSVSPFDSQGERYLYWASSFTSIYIALIFTILVSHFQLCLILSSILLVSLGLSLNTVNQNWKFAGEISESLLSSLQKMPIESPIITTIPDNFRGAYLYRTGLIQGLYLFDLNNRFNVQFEQKSTDKPFETVRFYSNNILLVMMNTLREPSDKIIVNSPQPNQYQFQLSNPQTLFFPTPKNTLVTKDYQVSDVQPQSYTLTLNNPNRFQDLLLYSSGEFVKLSD
ncbi:hypothetical protein [Planktothrix agardhii]|jgi:hypothetical protein|uniref:Transmembrane and TPR repeat-containing protein 2 n=1 Tax=Planktothrix agardhii TaxID=1160 RepID=A0AAD1Q3F5_PLAAG|nr:hypothetical protein [Planktothrix agardhii]BBD55261.1 hypothetical protein NIES204_25630 [Planktothrix agardhii NIES-204]MCB8760889.1 hypothetical protein [Planktothrix agardhii 1813]MCB8763307.1 hypothetical protein [Planktothrix agardhii 1809]MCB8776956.1 hypothetical protein [Planktothrix agardhii 1031]MCB8781387.1 hypothetical protein [Planktothrix agardhii 1808]